MCGISKRGWWGALQKENSILQERSWHAARSGCSLLASAFARTSQKIMLWLGDWWAKDFIFEVYPTLRVTSLFLVIAPKEQMQKKRRKKTYQILFYRQRPNVASTTQPFYTRFTQCPVLIWISAMKRMAKGRQWEKKIGSIIKTLGIATRLSRFHLWCKLVTGGRQNVLKQP